jgi:DNA-3-methyladenine glycosylase II
VTRTNGTLVRARREQARGIRCLCRRDDDLARVVETYGPPPLWSRTQGFPTLLYIILEQQVSLASARACYEKLLAAVTRLTPRTFLKLDDETLLAIGFSRQKRDYGRGLARALVSGKLDLDGLATLDDDEARARLMALRGIGRWTADIYLMMALVRMDIWPVGDLALATAAQKVKRLRKRPGPERLETLGRRWKPWRSVAAHILWYDYLGGRSVA